MVAEEIRREISQILQGGGIKDPAIPSVCSVTKVELSKDMRYAKLSISYLGDENKSDEVMKGLARCAGYLRHELGQRMSIYYVPELRFVYDRSMQYSAEIMAKLNELHENNQI